MVEFAVWHEGMDEGSGTWVLAVDRGGEHGEHLEEPGGYLLLADKEGRLYWRSVDSCKLVRVLTPDQARLVMAVTPQPAAGQIITSGIVPNRAMRRNGGG